MYMHKKDKNTYFKQYKWKYLTIVLLAGISSICSLLKTYSLSIVIDELIRQKGSDLLKNLIYLLTLMFFLTQGLSYLIGYLNTSITQEITYDLRNRIIRKLNMINIRWLQEQKSDRYVIGLTEDVNAVANLHCNYLVSLLNAALTALITIGLILYIDVQLAAVSFIVIVARVVFSVLFAKIAKKNQKNILENSAVHIGIIKQITIHMKYIRAYCSENVMLKKYDDCSQKISWLNFAAYLINYFYTHLNSILDFIGSIIVFALGVLSVYQNRISVGILFVFDSVTGMLSGSISSVVNIIISITKATVSDRRINDILATEEESREGIALHQEIRDISFSSVNFSYRETKIIDNFSYSFIKGGKYAIVGRSGIGKSTLANMFLKYYQQDSGKILINNMEIQHISADSIRSRIAIVFQDGIILDNCSVRENITFGNEVPLEQIEKVAKACHISDFADDLENGLDTIVRENGTNLSGGEKQRIYIARAMLRESDVYIFDESFVGMDSVLLTDMIQYIEEALTDKMVIIISHDVDLIKRCRNIIVFEDDRQIVCGCHSELLLKSSNYRKFVEGDDKQ